MDFNEYQRRAMETAVYPGRGTINGLYYTILGLAGEGGETANKTKKIIRDDNSILTESRKKELIKEIGGVLWYCAAGAAEMGVSLSEIARLNLEELDGRKQRGTLQGSGDNR